MKKTLSLILALLMSVSCASFAFADEASETAAIAEEAVVEEATPYDEAIIFLQDNKIMQGMEDGLIHAEKDVKRYEMAILAGRVSTGWVDNDQWMDDTANDSEFSDLAGTAAEDFYGVISYASQKGIVEGYTDGTFKPEQQVTYREALTMAVRTLGYTGLEWPWGYIEKAVALGITDGIEDIAYTTPLNRGVVAQIVYNTLFAKVNGSTLAMNIFGIDRAWENILVTADNRVVYAADGKTTKDGQVAFQIINENGTLDDEIYYVASDLEVGHPYRALFNVDEDAELVELVKAIECESTVTANVGITDNEGKAYDNPYQVEEVIGKYDGLGTKWDLNNVLSNSSYDDVLILVNAINMGEYEIVTSNEKYAFEIATGNILNLKWEDGKATTDGVKWYYSEKLDCYFEEILDEETGVKLYNIVDEDDVEKLLGDRYWTVKGQKGFTWMAKKPEKSAYAEIEVWDIDGKSYGWYESYKLGEISYKTDEKCVCKDVKGTYVNLAPVNSFAGDFGKDYFLEGQCEDCDDDNVTYRWVEGYEPSEDAKYVIYGVNEATRELKIVKEVEKLVGDVEDLTDVDTYYANGIVRGYRMSKETITIGEVSYEYNYNTLIGNALHVNADDDKDDKGFASRAAYSEWFSTLLNQYVEYVVVDGKIVYLEVVGADADNLIVVEKYVGVSSDNYIVVGGYSLDNLSYELFRIASYDGWKNGDKFWYGKNFDEDFAKGAVYEITSYDATTDSYNVTNVADANGQVNASDVEDYNVTISVVDRDYRAYTVNGETKTYKMTSSDKYIIVPERTGEYAQIMPIFVYEGKLPAAWTVKGDVIEGSYKSSTIVMVNADFHEATFEMDGVFGFNFNAYKYSMVVALDAVKTSAVYDGYGEDSWYIQGATTYTVEAFDLYAGKFVTVTATNIDVEEGMIYAAIDGEIVQDVCINWFEIDDWYVDNNPYSATYIVETMKILDEAGLDKWVSGKYNYNGTYDLVDDATYYWVDCGENGLSYYVTDITEIGSYSKFAAKFGDKYQLDQFWCTVVYNGEDALVYVYNDTAVDKDSEKTGTAKDTITEIVMYADENATVALNASSEWSGTIDGKTKELSSATIKGVTIGFEDSKWTHAQLLENGCVLGIDKHEYNDYIVKVDGALCDATVAQYKNCDDCEYVQSMTINFADAIKLDKENAEVTVNVVIAYKLTVGSITDPIPAYDLLACELTFTLDGDKVVMAVGADAEYNGVEIDAAILEFLGGIVSHD